MAVFANIEDLVGNTPLVRLSRFSAHLGLRDCLYAKLESANPTGSAKDRPALFMIRRAEEDGSLLPGGTIIEPTSGNTGIGLAAIGAARGYRVILVMPDTMSRERIQLLTAYGAQVVLTPGEKGMSGAIERAEALRASIPGAIIPDQFSNPENPRAHEQTTGPELVRDLGTNIAAFVAGVGTGGTLTGTARYLKKNAPGARVVAVEPASSPLLTKGYSGAHGLQGIGANFIPEILDLSLIDRTEAVSDADAFETAKLLARTEGLLCGITSGAALFAAAGCAREWNENRPIIALLPDSGTRYLSSGIYD